MRDAIAFVLGNFTLTFFVLGLIASAIALWHTHQPRCFLWGAAGVHIYQMIATRNFAPGNAGIIFYRDILAPIIGFIFLWLQRRLATGAGGIAVH
jgi:hypothetical protein